MLDWKEEAKLIADEAYHRYNNNENDTINFINLSMDICAEKLQLSEAYSIVYDARNNERNIFNIAKAELESNVIENKTKYNYEFNIDIDRIIFILALCIISAKAIEYYKQLVMTREEQLRQIFEKKDFTVIASKADEEKKDYIFIVEDITGEVQVYHFYLAELSLVPMVKVYLFNSKRKQIKTHKYPYKFLENFASQHGKYSYRRK